MGASPRGALGLLLLRRGRTPSSPAATTCTPEDVKAVAPYRSSRTGSRCDPELWMSDVSGTSVVRGVLAEVPVPGAQDASFRRPPGEGR